MKNKTIETVETIDKKKEENIMTNKETETIEAVEAVETTGKYIPDNELAESKKIMKGRTMYTINKDMKIVKTATVRCNPSSYDYNALKLFLDNNLELLERYFDDEDRYGIAFYACGYNGTAQDEFVEGWAEVGVQVF